MFFPTVDTAKKMYGLIGQSFPPDDVCSSCESCGDCGGSCDCGSGDCDCDCSCMSRD